HDAVGREICVVELRARLVHRTPERQRNELEALRQALEVSRGQRREQIVLSWGVTRAAGKLIHGRPILATTVVSPYDIVCSAANIARQGHVRSRTDHAVQSVYLG